MRWLYLISILLVNLSTYAPVHVKREINLQTLEELKIEKECLRRQKIVDAADSAAFVILDSYKRDKTDTEHAAFIEKVLDISDSLEIHFSWLVGIMKHESGINHRARNSIGAVGLIQFLPGTARGLGTSTYKLRNMTDVQQLDYVYKFYRHAKGKLNEMTDLYLYAFFPISVLNEWKDHRIIKYGKLSASLIAKQNRGLDLNKDGKVTVKEVKKQALKRLPKEILLLSSL